MGNILHKEDIKARLRKKHGTLAAFEVARELPGGSVKDVLRGRSIARTEAEIATELGKPLQEIFPRRYGGRSSSTKVDVSNNKVELHRLSEEAR